MVLRMGRLQLVEMAEVVGVGDRFDYYENY
jgi:glucose-6-phosphate 1-dehydrogenase